MLIVLALLMIPQAIWCVITLKIAFMARFWPDLRALNLLREALEGGATFGRDPQLAKTFWEGWRERARALLAEGMR